MKQNFNEINTPDIFKVGFLLFLRHNKFEISNVSLKELEKFIYRLSTDNYELISKKSTNIIIKNIFKYDPDDLRIFINSMLNEWVKDGEGIIFVENGSVTSSIDGLTEEEIVMLDHLTNTILKNLYSGTFNFDELLKNSIQDLLTLYNNNDSVSFYLDLNKTIYKTRILENSKFCVCCNDDNIDNLFGAPIKIFENEKLKGLNYDDNNITLCRNHLNLYVSGYFSFNSRGKIIIKKKNVILDEKMRLPIKLLTKERKYFLSFDK